ncbi:uncharacterized protein LY79DRAFT_573862 [Colletotrichum navitas]|uniref:Uncharacterized protein n=1 Tax=Colletotrichum navitas TaxID=681940 RepID=A0AAD8PJ40_9PEZI|nr:uncharacterized protein LY79DRAFT_573862 [Colletotrichum navitas]KAK1563970.1 hypothetical protein LY79DRAFT_573862 [Colletotrichum navitas]
MASTTERPRDERSPLYQRAFPNTNWNVSRDELILLPTMAERIAYLTTKFPGIIRIACLSSSDPIQAHVERVRKAFTKIIRHPDHANKTGADLGLTTVPPTLLDGLLTRYAVTSSAIKLGELADIDNSIPKVYAGATIYFMVMMMPSRDGEVSAMHTESVIVPDDDRDETYITCTSISYAGPFFLKERQAIMGELHVSQIDTAASEGTLNSLLVGEDVGIWGTDIMTSFLGKEHTYLTSPELLSQCRTPGLEKLSNDAACLALFQLRLAYSIRLTQEEHSSLRRLQEINRLSTNRGHMLVLGRGTSENSCLANCFYDVACVKDGFFPANQVFTNSPESLFVKLNERADVVYAAKEPGSHLRIHSFLNEQDRGKHYDVVSKSAGEEMIKDVFRSKSIFNIYKGGSTTSWGNKYTTHGDELPEEVERFFALVMDIFASYVENWADSLPSKD